MSLSKLSTMLSRIALDSVDPSASWNRSTNEISPSRGGLAESPNSSSSHSAPAFA